MRTNRGSHDRKRRRLTGYADIYGNTHYCEDSIRLRTDSGSGFTPAISNPDAVFGTPGASGPPQVPLSVLLERLETIRPFMDINNAAFVEVLVRNLEKEKTALVSLCWEEARRNGCTLAMATIHARIGCQKSGYRDGHVRKELRALSIMTDAERTRCRYYGPETDEYRKRRYFYKAKLQDCSVTHNEEEAQAKAN